MSDPTPSGYEPTVRGPESPRSGDQLEPALGEFLEALSEARFPRAQIERVRALIRLGKEADRRALPMLEAAASDRDWIVRKYAVSGLGRFDAPEVQPRLLEALGDDRPEVRRAAARALARRDTAMATWLDAARDTDWHVRGAAIDGLSRHRDPAAEEALVAALADAVWLNRYQAMRALESRRSPRGLAALLAALDHDRALAPWLASAIATFGTDTVPALLAVLDGAPPWRRLAIASALGRLDDERARAALTGLVGHPDPEIEEAIRHHGPAMRSHLAEALGAASWTVRAHAAKLLGRLGEPAASVSLLPLIADARPEVRLAALEALKQLADPRAEADLKRVLADPSWHQRLGAVEALGALDTDGALEALVSALADRRGEVVMAARRELAAKGDRAEEALVEGLLRHPGSYDEISWLLKALKRPAPTQPEAR
jgi:HEAT repeat protein